MFRKKNDLLLKSAFEDTFPEFLRFYISEADAIFDIERGFDFMDKELQEIMPQVQHPGGNRFVDMLVKTWLRNGKEEWILIHIEIQGQNDDDFAKRMFTYYYRVLDRYNASITAYAIFTGDKNQKRPGFYENHFLGTSLLYTYNSYHIYDHSEAELLAMNNPFALVILAAQKALLAGKIPEAELGEQRWTIAKALIESGQYNHEQIQKFILFLKNFIQIDSPELNSIFEGRIDLLTGKKDTMGILETVKYIAWEEGREEGEEKKAEKVVVNAIVVFGFSDEQAANMADVSLEFVQNIRQQLEQKK